MQETLEERVVHILYRLGWESWALTPWKSKSLKHCGISAKIRFSSVSFQGAPYIVIAIPQDFKLSPFREFYQRYLDMNEPIRLMMDFFHNLSPHSLLLFFDGRTSLVYAQPDEGLLGHSDSPESFHEKILGLLRPELAFSPDIFTEIQHHRLVKLGKELQKWLRQWVRKIESVADIDKSAVTHFLRKLILWRVASYTQENKTAQSILARYIFPESKFQAKRVRMPSASKDIPLAFDALAHQNRIELFKLTPDDILLTRRTQYSKLLTRLLWELNMLSRCKCSSSVLAHYMDVEENRPAPSSPQRSRKKHLKQSKRGENYILELPPPRHLELESTNFVTLLKEVKTSFDALMNFRSDVMSQSKKSRERLLIQEDMFVQDKRPLCDYKDLLNLLVLNGIKIVAKDERIRQDADFVVTAWLMETQHNYNLPSTSFPSLKPLFNI